MYAVLFGGIELPVSSEAEAWQVAGSDSWFPSSAERRAKRAERKADLQFRMAKGYPLPLLARLRKRLLPS